MGAAIVGVLPYEVFFILDQVGWASQGLQCERVPLGQTYFPESSPDLGEQLLTSRHPWSSRMFVMAPSLWEERLWAGGRDGRSLPTTRNFLRNNC